MRRTLAAFAAASLLALAACSSTDGAMSEDSGGDSAGAAAEAPDAGSSVERQALNGTADLAYAEEAADADALAQSVGSTTQDVETVARSEIKTGNVALRSEDVGQAIFDVGQVVDGVAGEVEQDKTETDKSGEALRSRMVIRVPADRFDDAMAGLKEAADLVSASSNSKDVTTEVLDVGVRVQVQRRSIQRIALLLDRATSIRDIVAIEAQLSRRQADLASLEKQQTFLADQTSMSTITVSVERTRPEATPPPPEEDETGFLSGLDAGWDALKTFGVGLATFLGAVLPWTLVLLVLGIPGVALARRLRRRSAGAPTPTA